jgi:hypothetical protein
LKICYQYNAEFKNYKLHKQSPNILKVINKSTQVIW